MCRVRCEISEGLIASEKVVRISTSDGGIEEVTVSGSMIDQSSGTLHASAIGIEDEQRALIELPRESASGKWRVWVNKSNLSGR